MEFREAVAQLDSLVRLLERDGDERALQLLQLIDAVHRPALELIARGEAEHPIAQAVLAMYDLVEPDDRVLVEEVLDAARAGGASVELVAVEGGVARVRTDRPDLVGHALGDDYEVVVEGPPRVVVLPLAAPQYVEVEDVEDGELHGVSAADASLLLAGVEGEVYAFRNECAVDAMPLDGGRLAGTVIVCPWHNCAYDARSGKRVDGEDGRLRPVPAKRADGVVKVAI